MATEPQRALRRRSSTVNRTLTHLTNRKAVLDAMREYDRLGGDGATFLERYGFHRARSFLLHGSEGRTYDSKAIAGVAFGLQHPQLGYLKSDEFSGGEPVRKALDRLNFVVIQDGNAGRGFARTDDTTDDVFVEPPAPPTAQKARQRTFAPRQDDHAVRDAANRDLGKKGEKWVLNIEINRLKKGGHSDLAARVEWTSKEKGDGAGYDIASFDENGKPLFVEVKTTNGNDKTPFIVSAKELAFAQKHPKSFVIYRVYEFETEPKVFRLNADFGQHYPMEPTAFRVRLK